MDVKTEKLMPEMKMSSDQSCSKARPFEAGVSLLYGDLGSD